LAIVFDDVARDSRFKRACSVLSERYDLHIACSELSGETGYQVLPVSQSTSRLVRMLVLIVQAAKFMMTRKPSVIFCGGLLPLVCARLLGVFHNGKIIYDARELYLKDSRNESTYSGLHRFLEDLAIYGADLVLSANELRAQKMRDYYQLANVPLAIQNITPYTKHNELVLPNEFHYLNDEGQKFVVYQGDLGNTRGMERFIYAFCELPADYHLVFIARGAGVSKLKNLAQQKNIHDRCHFHGYQEHSMLLKILSHCDLGIISYEMFGPNNRYCAPNKLYEYASAHLPMITSPQQTFIETFSKYKIGVAVDELSWSGFLTEALVHYVTHGVSLKNNGEDFEKFLAQNNWDNEKDKFMKALENLDRV
jgi:glycosyltransferase involved in cell wall biosynthesis